jgi:hypothetical protein
MSQPPESVVRIQALIDVDISTIREMAAIVLGNKPIGILDKAILTTVMNKSETCFTVHNATVEECLRVRGSLQHTLHMLPVRFNAYNTVSFP